MYGEIAGLSLKAINEIGNLIKGIKQKNQGKKIQRELDAQGRPLLKTPEAFSEMEGLVRNNYLNPNLEGETQMINRLNASNANALKNIERYSGSGIDALTAAAMSNANTDARIADVGIASANAQQQRLQQLLSLLSSKSNLQQNQFESNVLSPYLQRGQQAQALIEGGMANIDNSMNDLANLGIAAGQMFDKAKSKVAGALLGKGLSKDGKTQEVVDGTSNNADVQFKGVPYVNPSNPSTKADLEKILVELLPFLNALNKQSNNNYNVPLLNNSPLSR